MIPVISDAIAYRAQIVPMESVSTERMAAVNACATMDGLVPRAPYAQTRLKGHPVIDASEDGTAINVMSATRATKAPIVIPVKMVSLQSKMKRVSCVSLANPVITASFVNHALIVKSTTR